MRKHRAELALLLGAGALTLTGCSVSLVGVTGLTVAHGHVYALVKMCPGTSADEVHMIPAAGQFFLIPHPSWGLDKTDAGSVDLGTTRQFLELVGNDEQRFQTSASGGAGGSIIFDKSDVTSLRPGQILASSSTSASPTVVDATGFDALAKDLCARY